MKCLNCKKEFTSKSRNKKPAKFCSSKCYGESKRGKPTWNKGKKMKGGWKHSEETKKVLSQKKIGVKNPNWKGCNATYEGIHTYLLRNFPKNNVCDFCKKERKTERALKSGKVYTRNINDYYELCNKCHRRYDIKNGLLSWKNHPNKCR